MTGCGSKTFHSCWLHLALQFPSNFVVCAWVQMDFQEKQEKAQEARRNRPPGQQPGGLSLNRSLDLNK